MNFFKKLPGFSKTPPGLERQLLRRLPATLLYGTLLLSLPSLLMRLAAWLGYAAVSAAPITTIDIFAISLIIVHWSIALTVAIGAFIVLVMKGPAYVADAYPLIDSDAPRSD